MTREIALLGYISNLMRDYPLREDFALEQSLLLMSSPSLNWKYFQENGRPALWRNKENRPDIITMILLYRFYVWVALCCR